MVRLCLEPGPMGRAHGSPSSSGPCAVAPHLSRRTGTYSTGLRRRHACILPARVGTVVFVMGMVLPRCAVGSSGDGIPGVASDANPPKCRRHGEFPPPWHVAATHVLSCAAGGPAELKALATQAGTSPEDLLCNLLREATAAGATRSPPRGLPPQASPTLATPGPQPRPQRALAGRNRGNRH